MNIKEHIEAGHYSGDPVVLVPTKDAGVARIYSTRLVGKSPLLGVVPAGICGWNPCLWTEDGRAQFIGSDCDLLPPAPRKVKVTAWGIIAHDTVGMPYVVHVARTEAEAKEWGCSGQRRVELVGEYEEPWS